MVDVLVVVMDVLWVDELVVVLDAYKRRSRKGMIQTELIIMQSHCVNGYVTERVIFREE